MPAHMNPAEVQLASTWFANDISMDEICRRLAAKRARKMPVGQRARNVRRARKKKTGPSLSTVRRAIKGRTFRRGEPERRGRKRVLTRRLVLKMNKVRKALLKKAKSEYEVRWRDVVRVARAPRVHRSTAKRSFHRNALPVLRRTAREKPQRTPEVERERVAMCTPWTKRRPAYFNDEVHLIIDNKKFLARTRESARMYMRKLRVRGHLRLKSEGLKKECTKPSRRKNRMNTGGTVNVCAGVGGGRILLWHYLPQRWNSSAAAALYRGPILRALKKQHGEKRKYKVIEDNDPTGFKSKAACDAKKEAKIEAMQFPRYSPDLNPLDYSIWNEIEARVTRSYRTKKAESVKQFKKRLRRVAMSLPEGFVRKAVASMPKRARAVVSAKGGNISMD